MYIFIIKLIVIFSLVLFFIHKINKHTLTTRELWRQEKLTILFNIQIALKLFVIDLKNNLKNIVGHQIGLNWYEMVRK